MEQIKNYLSKVYHNLGSPPEVKFTQIVSEMDDDHFFNEKQSIRESGRSLKKYGSTCNHVRNNEILIRHDIEMGDTLQGIALKYGCSTEQIRRANRLFASDSLYLRQFLMIPVDKNSPYYPKDDRPNSLPPQRAASITGYPGYQKQNSLSLDQLSPEEESKKNIDEFLGKIDTSIAESKKLFNQTRKNSDFISTQLNDDDYPNDRYPSTSSNQHYHSRQSSSSSNNIENNNPSHIVVMTQGRRVQSSLQKFEKQQDDFFQL